MGTGLFIHLGHNDCRLGSLWDLFISLDKDLLRLWSHFQTLLGDLLVTLILLHALVRFLCMTVQLLIKG